MTVSAPTAETATNRGDAGDLDELSHYYCCNRDLALCGADVSGLVEAEGNERPPRLCVVCELLTSCPLCGQKLYVQETA